MALPYCMNLKFKRRIVVGGLVSLAVLVCFHQQKIYAVSLRDMVYKKPPKIDPVEGYCPFMLETESIENSHNPPMEHPDFFWEEDVTRAITQAFFVGFFIFSIPTGVMADYLGGRWFLGIGVLVLSTCTLLFPILARPDAYYFIIGRLCQGAAQALMLSGSSVLLAHWVPHSERATFTGVLFSAKQFGIVLGQLQLRLFRKLELKWVAMCYTSGAVGIICSIFLLVFLPDSPGRCHHITRQERYYIRSQTRSVDYTRGKTDLKQLVPWKQMFSSKPFLSMFLFQIGWSWIRVVLLSRVDKYMISVIHMTRDLTYNCLALAMVAMGVSSVVGGVVGDRLINKGLISRTTHRKLFGFFGNTLVLPLLLASVAIGCDGALVCALYAVIFYINGLVDCSFAANALDLAPRHVGVTFALLNCMYSFSVLFNRELYQAVCQVESSMNDWVKFYLVCGLIVLFCSLPFLFFGSAEIQPYNSLDGRLVREDSGNQRSEPQGHTSVRANI